MGQLVKHLRCFRSDDTGAVTIDWVALGSAILLVGIMVVYSIFNNGVSTLVSNVNSTRVGQDQFTHSLPHDLQTTLEHFHIKWMHIPSF